MNNDLYQLLLGKRNREGRASVQLVLITVALCAAVYVFRNGPGREGLELMWLIPISFIICICLFGRILDFGAGTVGLKIFYAISAIRYIVSPVLIAMTQGKVNMIRMTQLPRSSYEIAIIIQIVELFVCAATIYFDYPKVVQKYVREDSENKPIESGIHFGGYLVLLFFIAVLMLRFSIWYPALQIYGIKKATASGIVLENTFFSCVKTTLFVMSLSKTIQRKGKKGFVTSFLMTIFCVIICLVTTFGSNRSFTLELVATIVVLMVYYFPKYKTGIIVCVVPLAITVIFSMIVTKQFDLETATQFSRVSFDLQYVSNQLEEYTNGLWCIAQSYDASIGLTITQRFQATVKELVDALIVPLEMPGLKGMFDFTKDWISTASVMKYAFQNYDRGQMLSFSAGYLINFGILGWILFPIANCIAMKLLIRFSVAYHFSNTVLDKFMYLWSTFLFGLTLCYCTQTLLYCMSRYILFLWIVKKASKVKGKLGNRII